MSRRSRSKSPRNTATPDRTRQARRLGQLAARGLADGSLYLGQVLGLTEVETAAIVEAAETHRRAGRLGEALAVYGLLAAHFPLCPAYWRAMACLAQRLGQHVAAVACFEVLAALQGRDADCARDQARSMSLIGLTLTDVRQAAPARPGAKRST